MTTAEMMPALGAVVLVACDGLQVRCKVLDAKESWGRPRLRVTPISGAGSIWVELGRVAVPCAQPELVALIMR